MAKKNALKVIVGPETDLITVDYSQPLEEMIAAGHYDWVHGSITAEHFPLSGTGQVSLDTVLVYFNQELSTDNVLVELDRQGLRPATIAELLAFKINDPVHHRKYPIHAFGSVWSDEFEHPHSPYVFRDGLEYHLDCSRRNNTWGAGCRFLAVRK